MGGATFPNKKKNYTIALIIGLAIPIIIMFIRDFFNSKLQSVEDIQRRTRIPIIGVIGHSEKASNVVVIDSPKSSISESFRRLRSNLSLSMEKETKGGTILLTSSMSGEGKTFCAINLASVFSLTGKPTLLMGLDLRRPKIYNDFDLTNDVGLTNFLIGEVGSDQIVQNTKVDNLDILVAGPVPPNPSELLMSQEMDDLMAELKKKYTYIILDSPPVGLVADSFELNRFSDLNLYLARYGYTDKELIGFIDEQYKNHVIDNLFILYNDFQVKSGYGYGYYDDDDESSGLFGWFNKKWNGKKWTLAYWKEVLYRFRSRRRLQNHEFSIISNNCWAGGVYELLNEPYRTPTVGLFFYAPCYIEFLNDLKEMLERELHFIPISKYKEANQYRSSKGHHYPIGLLGESGPEIHFLHYSKEEEANEKWRRRRARVNHDNLFLKFCDRDLCQPEHRELFLKRAEQKVFFSSKPFQDEQIVYLRKFQNEEYVGDLYSNP